LHKNTNIYSWGHSLLSDVEIEHQHLIIYIYLNNNIWLVFKTKRKCYI